ncbi:MBL fold metallo-hydrolase [Austwickia chelonae]|uniref:MBL fold metallo-hydrolase n=1 Tax=Austwickia chelonae TaxID=100225 RepID=UPI000E236E6D|nr:MBL fold metallo-hydrolase [Austwickia chelonae]
MNGPDRQTEELVARPPRWAQGTWAGGRWSDRVDCIVCPNPSAMTLEGTNTWIVADPGDESCLVVDPGPLDEEHLRRVLGRIGERRVSRVLLTHRHPDHAAGAHRFADLAHCHVNAIGDGRHDLADGDVLRECGVEVHVVATPGHSGDSISYLVADDRALLTGDTVLGWGTSVVDWPDGSLAEYLLSLEKIAALIADGQVTDLLPGHGGPIAHAAEVVEAYRRHRLDRLDQIRAALSEGASGVSQVVDRVYAGLDPALRPAAERSVQAQLAYLRVEGLG